jgi:DNA modification methylase
MKIEQIATDKLIPYARNAKRHDAAQVSKLAGSIREFGFNNPVLIDKDNGIVAGHGRVMAAQKLELKTVPCIRLGHLTDTQRRAYILADNRLAEVNSGWDEELLKLEIKDIDWGELKEISIDDFEFGEIDFGEEGKEETQSDSDAEPQIDKAEELRAKWGVEPGQLWELGAHRLLCGDSTKKEDVERVMSGEKLQAVVTDPPYGMSAVSSSGVLKERYGKDIAGDETPELARNVFRTLSGAKIPQIWWGANYYADATGGSSCWLVWDKNNGGSDQADAELAWTNLPGVVRIFKIASEKINRLHPTQKHPSLIRWCIEKCGAAQSIYEPFSGSGTTIIACEQLGRKCRAIEISPAYVAVALQRWADATGKTPRKL